MRIHLLISSASLALAACYSPDVRDCSVSCSAVTDCAGDQVCGADGFCVGPDVGPCNRKSVDGGVNPPRVTLRVQIEGTGKVMVLGVGACSTRDTSNGDCSWLVAPGAVLLTPMMLEPDKAFEQWTTPNCSGQNPTCAVTASTTTVVGAKFK
jgi:hypothetical protein